MGRTKQAIRVPEVTIRNAERFNRMIVSNGLVDGVKWTASKCHPDPHIQWSVGLPEHHLDREQAEILCCIVCRYLLRNAVAIQSKLPVIAPQETSRSVRRRTTA